jgi:hypothetical protein
VDGIRSLPVIGSRRAVGVRASRRSARLENDIHAARRLLTAKQALTEQVNRHVRLLKTQSALLLKLSLDIPWSSTSSTPQAPRGWAE